MIKSIFIVVIILSFIVFIEVIIENNNAYAHSDYNKIRKTQQWENNTSSESATTMTIITPSATVNMTDKMKFLCIQIDASGVLIDQIKDKKQQAQCKKFLDSVSIYEMRELIDKYKGVQDN